VAQSIHTATGQGSVPFLPVLALILAVGTSPAVAQSFGAENVVSSSYSHSGYLSCSDVDSDGDVDLVVAGDGSKTAGVDPHGPGTISPPSSTRGKAFMLRTWSPTAILI
jgi:hypothetical protein